MSRKLKAVSRITDSPFKPLKGLSVSATERDEFLAALDQVEPLLSDAVAVDIAPPRAQPRRLKQLERGQLKPAEELDLHGLTREEALARTRAFLMQAVQQGWPLVVIITGKGLHSQEGPVLRQAVTQLLATSRELVLEWGAAPRQYGGAGALAVFPRLRRD